MDNIQEKKWEGRIFFTCQAKLQTNVDGYKALHNQNLFEIWIKMGLMFTRVNCHVSVSEVLVACLLWPQKVHHQLRIARLHEV